MSEVTQERANLMLRLYELRREPVMREACAWFLAKLHPKKRRMRLQRSRAQRVHCRNRRGVLRLCRRGATPLPDCD
jgi:hypothetical protein